MTDIADLKDALFSGYIDKEHSAKNEYKPQLITNDSQKGIKVLTSILSELSELEPGDEFFFSVAFVTNGGIATLIDKFKELENKGIKGKIIASQYQNFTEPRALQRLIQFKNLEVRIQTDNNFHAKGYLFRKGTRFDLIIGSSNLTQNALCENKEWNLRVSSLKNGSLTQDVKKEFEQQFEIATPVTQKWIETYKIIYEAQRKATATVVNNVIDIAKKPVPNRMQVEALSSLTSIRASGRNRALLISATGTGKTFLSAFDAKAFDAKRLLFVVHREKIAKDALKTFKAVFGPKRTYGLYTGNTDKGIEGKSDFVFSTILTISKDEYLNSFNREEFDYIVMDEAHHMAADTYQKVLSYFNPRFLLGMTATPERTDDKVNVFKLFDYNIAYELRLHDALELKMLTPFHYYGVTDLTVDGTVVDDVTQFSYLTCEERIKNIIDKAIYYGCDRGRIKGLIFCRNVDEAVELEKGLNAHGLKTKALTGDSSEEEREHAIELLESDDVDSYYEYLLTVDIFNEGVDIPSINQIILLRPTQSAIVFVQQLGRGLRKRENKDYLTVIDFIGNYNNNFLIPIALYGDSSYNKDSIRKYLSNGSALIPGASTISFDEITKERIYQAIDRTNLGIYKDLRRDYQLLKYKLGRIPNMIDFLTYGSREPFAYAENKGSYYAFLCKEEPEIFKPFENKLMQKLSYYSLEVCNGKRLEDTIILEKLLNTDSYSVNDYRNDLESCGLEFGEKTLRSCINLLNGHFLTDTQNEKYCVSEICQLENDVIKRNEEFNSLIRNENFAKELRSIAEYGIRCFLKNYNKENYRDGFILYEKYSRKDACRIFCWPRNEESTIYGYQIKHDTCPIFVTYNKKDEIKGSGTDYDDYFINRSMFHWMTKNNRTLDSKDVQAIGVAEEIGLRISLFVKKSDGEGDDFYYMGDVSEFDCTEMTIKDEKKGKQLPIVNINFLMDDEVDESIYRYFEDSKRVNHAMI